MTTWAGFYSAAVIFAALLPAHHSILFRSWQSHTFSKGDYPFWNASLPWAERVDDLVARLTLKEIQIQLSSGGGTPAPAIPRLGIGPYQWWSNCGRGDAGAPGNATAFPQVIGLAAAFRRKHMDRFGGPGRGGKVRVVPEPGLMYPRYTNWGSTEPNDGNHNEDCVTTRTDGIWWDWNCKIGHSFICQQEGGADEVIG
ncbi:uncharacterized protein [Littorina saxatilis]|uniref:uncharacterized protein n=1 Tax=Littorina saxatilis TaxID=31220 RepID=UPI0038B4EB03